MSKEVALEVENASLVGNEGPKAYKAHNGGGSGMQSFMDKLNEGPWGDPKKRPTIIGILSVSLLIIILFPIIISSAVASGRRKRAIINRGTKNSTTVKTWDLYDGLEKEDFDDVIAVDANQYVFTSKIDDINCPYIISIPHGGLYFPNMTATNNVEAPRTNGTWTPHALNTMLLGFTTFHRLINDDCYPCLVAMNLATAYVDADQAAADAYAGTAGLTAYTQYYSMLERCQLAMHDKVLTPLLINIGGTDAADVTGYILPFTGPTRETQDAATCTLPTVLDRDVHYPSYFKMEGRGFFSLLEDKQYEIALPETNPIWPSNATFIGTKRISTVMSRPNADRDYGVDSMDLKFHTTLRNDQASSMKSGRDLADALKINAEFWPPQ